MTYFVVHFSNTKCHFFVFCIISINFVLLLLIHALFSRVTDQNLQVLRALLKKPGVDVLPHVFKNDSHSEHSWEKELPVWMKELEIG